MDDYLQKKITIQNKKGLHARASAKFCTLASKFNAEIKVKFNKIEIGACSIMAMLMLGVSYGKEITIISRGKEKEQAIDALCNLINNKFDED